MDDSSLPASMETIESSSLPASMDVTATLDNSLPSTMEADQPTIKDPIKESAAPNNDIIILFDLETTGLAKDSDITQIAAEVVGQNNMWSKYLIPNQDIGNDATQVTGIHVEETDGARVLMVGNEEVDAASYEDGLTQFYHYLCQLSNGKDPNSRLILVAHNAKRFDAPILVNAFKKINVSSSDLLEKGIYFADSLEILRKLQKDQHPLLNNPQADKEGGKKLSLGLGNLYRHLFQEDFPAHDATEDVKAMKRILFERLQLDKSFISNETFSI
ncbi:PREDICTED: exonuclease DPD1, chloroplastic/mitochondrial-like [Amphimedon queenslandica]|uniref:Exonuclease domain-containing protein n=1 Tax=Amphimedon queenslandica TaxID=400682 RepID=A0A1X7TIH3_AMPQE|nr:PREDICTED: exonuclease DPD1, chloroplastic/mitochondrial-like [Amphimedon queenslandica]|eukprot:XP_011407521.1 PREDICTED: exonuclease DPD1, chloroplastic/mitochondrial-like [Amphimedon queenslandica]